MNDHRNHRHRAGEPAWPTGEDPEFRAAAKQQGDQPEERTGFWSPLWEDEDEPPGRSTGNGHGRANGREGHHGTSNGTSNGSSNGAGNGAGNGNGRSAHQWPEEEPARPQPPARPRPAPRSPGPVWPSTEGGGPAGPPPGAGTPRPGPRRPGGPHTPPPGVPQGPNGFPTGGRPPAGPPGAPTRVVRPRPAGPHGPGGPGGPGGGVDGPTELITPVSGGRTGPEPQLLTHREPDYDEDLNDDPDLDGDYYDEDEDGPLSEEDRKKRRKKIWKRVRRTMYVLIVLMIIGPMVAFFVAYQMVEVPSPEEIASEQEQVVTLMYGDPNKSEFTKIVPPGGNRTFVEYNDIPKTVLRAVYAAEDAEFESNPGFDITGVIRAGWNQVTGGSGGGSTITQQYIKKATNNEEKSLTRKALEVVKAYKMNNTYNKEEIITAYLNTIYFGRGAHGIVAASQAYFGKPLDQLAPSEAALLGGMIQSPSRYDERDYQQRRWNFVMDQMVDKGWLSAEDRKAAQFPLQIDIEDARPEARTGPDAIIQRAVLKELEERADLSLDDLQQKGLTVWTTIDPTIQKKAIDALNRVLADEPLNLRTAMVAVNPKNGEVLAYYGGADGNGLDWAAAPQEPGSSFKPFDLVALLKSGKGLGETYDGRSPRIFDGRPVKNSENAQCSEQCTVAEAMKRSINTVFYDIALNEVGTQKVADAAKAAGVNSPLVGENGGPPDANISIGGGRTQVTTYEMASAYATFAANGMYRKPHLVRQVTWPDGSLYWAPPTTDTTPVQAFDRANADLNKKIARNVTESLIPVLEQSKLTCAEGRQCAGKTGTHQLGATEDNAKAWMVGYTPSVSTAVSMTAEDENGTQVPVKNARGKIVYGSGLPGEIWKTFMDDYLKGSPKENFGKFEPIGKPAQEKKPASNRPTESNVPPPTNGPTGPTGPGNTPSTEPSDPDDPTTDPPDPDDPGTIIPPIGQGPGNGGSGGGRGNDNDP